MGAAFILTFAGLLLLQGARPIPVDSGMKFVRADRATPVRALFAHFRARPKGEFETTSEYHQRVTLAEPRPFYLVLVPESQAPITYSADDSTMTVVVNRPSYEFAYRSDLVVQSRRRNLGFYPSTTAGGARLQITRTLDSTFSFVVPDADRILDPGEVWFRIAPDSARKLKPHLLTALLVRPSNDSVGGAAVATAKMHIPPTFEDPRDRVTDRQIMQTDWMAILVYDRRSGRVLQRRVHGDAR
jgi:hypothetical protein